jgi:hypothetical protein
MNLKYKILFFNFLIFLAIFDVIYLVVWILSIHMNPVKAVIVAGLAALLTPWVRPANQDSGQKVMVKSFVLSFLNKYLKK